MAIEPLTHCDLNGKVYERLPQILRQIETALAMDDPSLLRAAQIRDYHDPAFLSEECLVYLIRRYRQEQEQDLVNVLSEALCNRCAKQVNERLQGLDPSLVDDAFQDVMKNLFDRILDLKTDRGDFLQVRFWIVLKRLTITVFQTYVRVDNHAADEVPLSSLAGDDGPDDDHSVHTSAPAFPDPSPSAEEVFLLREGLHAIPEPYRTAFVLHMYHEWQIESNDPTVMTLSRRFQKTPRTISNWLKRAEEALALWRQAMI